MSGGHFHYNQYSIDEIAGEIKDIIRNNNDESVNEYKEVTEKEITITLFHLKYNLLLDSITVDREESEELNDIEKSKQDAHEKGGM